MNLPTLKKSLVPLVLSLTTLAGSALALEPNKDGWYHTGDAMRTKSIAFVSVKVYAIGHDMKCLPSAKSKQAVIDADCDKRFVWTMQRDVDQAKVQNALREGYALNGYSDTGKVNQALAAFSAELKEGKHVTISFNAAAKTTTFTVEGGGTATVAGADFMKATWSVWFGKIDPPSIGDNLMARL